jgi:hypothetical protein
MFNLTKLQAQQIERLQANPDYQLYQQIVEHLKSEQENQAFLHPSEAYEHLVARNVYQSVLDEPQRLVNDVREKLRIEETMKESATASY